MCFIPLRNNRTPGNDVKLHLLNPFLSWMSSLQASEDVSAAVSMTRYFCPKWALTLVTRKITFRCDCACKSDVGDAHLNHKSGIFRFQLVILSRLGFFYSCICFLAVLKTPKIFVHKDPHSFSTENLPAGKTPINQHSQACKAGITPALCRGHGFTESSHLMAWEGQ